jgi:hypothetical protein
MIKRKESIDLGILILCILFFALTVFTASSFADTLADAIAKTPQGTEKGMIDPDAKHGFLQLSALSAA